MIKKMRKGLGKGKGMGYKNLIVKDKVVHSQSAKGIKQPEKLGSAMSIAKFETENKKEGKIKNWNKIIDNEGLVCWRNNRWLKTEDKWATIEEVSVNKSWNGWTFLYFINNGKNDNVLKNNIARSKTEAVKYAIDYMRKKKNKDKVKFTGKELKEIEERTENNNHTENLVFIGKKIKYSKLKDLLRLKKRQNNRGYLDEADSGLKYKFYQDIMKELKEKAPKDYDYIYQSL